VYTVKIRKENQGNDDRTKHLRHNMEREWPEDLVRWRMVERGEGWVAWMKNKSSPYH
jgi:hypothetical protein